MGETLYQDIGTQVTASRVHSDWEIYDQNFHNIRVECASHLANLYPDNTAARVCSVHHQPVKDVGRNLVVEARSVDDSLVEAMRLEGRRTLNIELKCANCKGDLRLIALIKTAVTIKKILAAMGLPTLPPTAAPARLLATKSQAKSGLARFLP